ncbi:STAS domain-containing protein [Pseudonocardia saturnea]
MSVQCNSARSVLRCGSAPGARGEPAAEGTWCRCTTAVIPGPGGQVIVVRVEGELDLCTVEHLLTELGSLLALRPAHLIVDLSELRFCSARGLSVLSRAGDTAIGLGIGYAVAGASARLNWVWLKCWTEVPPLARRPTIMAVGREGSLRWQHRRSTPTSCVSALSGSTLSPTHAR